MQQHRHSFCYILQAITGSIWTCSSSITDASSGCFVKVDQSQEGGQDSECTATANPSPFLGLIQLPLQSITAGFCPPLPCSALLPPPFHPLHSFNSGGSSDIHHCVTGHSSLPDNAYQWRLLCDFSKEASVCLMHSMPKPSQQRIGP